MSNIWHGGDAAHCFSRHWIGCYLHRKAQLRNRVLGQDPEQCSGAQGRPLAAALQPTPCRAQATQETSQSTSGRWGSHAAPIAAQELCRLKRLSTKDERPVRNAGSDGAIPPAERLAGRWGVPRAAGVPAQQCGTLTLQEPDPWAGNGSASELPNPPTQNRLLQCHGQSKRSYKARAASSQGSLLSALPTGNVFCSKSRNSVSIWMAERKKGVS